MPVPHYPVERLKRIGFNRLRIQTHSLNKGKEMRPIQFMLVQRGLVGKIDFNMELTGKVTSLSVAKRNGWTYGKTNRQALIDINSIAESMGWETRWSAKYGDESGQPATVMVDAN